MKTFLTILLISSFVFTALPQSNSEFNRPWKTTNNPLILDAYHKNPIDWELLAKHKRVAAIIHKATEGINFSDPRYIERKTKAKSSGYKWGSFHLIARGNTIKQAEHYLSVIGKTSTDELMALDVECTAETRCENKNFKVRIKEMKLFLNYVKRKTGRYPILYANQSVTADITSRFRNDTLFPKIALWYARFKQHVTNFPKQIWKTYALWQFASEINCAVCTKWKDGDCIERDCAKKQPGCPCVVSGTDLCMDINIYNGSMKNLRKNWSSIGN